MAELSEDLFKKIQRIQILSTQLAKDLLAGAYRSAFKGKGMEFEEVRDYQPGDDIRTIDWNVTARMNHPYVKNFREERDLTVILLVDVSASSRFGSKNLLKSEIVAEIGAVLAFSAIKNNDRVGLILFSDIVEKYVPPRKGTRHVLRVIRELLAFHPKETGSDPKVALNFLGKVQTKSGICFFISDFMFSDYSHEASLIAKRHDLIAMCITDPSEEKMPDIGLAQLDDLETKESIIVDTSSPKFQSHFSETYSKRILEHNKLMKKLGADFVDISTDESYVRVLHKFFKLRHGVLR